jgi:hypothetical protein
MTTGSTAVQENLETCLVLSDTARSVMVTSRTVPGQMPEAMSLTLDPRRINIGWVGPDFFV